MTVLAGFGYVTGFILRRQDGAEVRRHGRIASMPRVSINCSSLAAGPLGCLPDAGDSHFWIADTLTFKNAANAAWLMRALLTRMAWTSMGENAGGGEHSAATSAN